MQWNVSVEPSWASPGFTPTVAPLRSPAEQNQQNNSGGHLLTWHIRQNSDSGPWVAWEPDESHQLMIQLLCRWGPSPLRNTVWDGFASCVVPPFFCDHILCGIPVRERLLFTCRNEDETQKQAWCWAAPETEADLNRSRHRRTVFAEAGPPFSLGSSVINEGCPTFNICIWPAKGCWYTVVILNFLACCVCACVCVCVSVLVLPLCTSDNS